jgi:alkylation response protein AidB-like acyl-CoA dehydrogenase
MIVNGDVLDVTRFATGHPGGEKVILDYAGKDATKVFYSLHRHEVLEQRLARLKVGTVEGYDKATEPTAWKQLSKVPYAEIDMDGVPFYKESHKRFRLVVRQFLYDEGVLEWSEKAEMTGEPRPPPEMFEKCGRVGLMALFAGVGEHLKRIPEPNLWSRAGIKPEEIDLFHVGIAVEEQKRMLCPGAEDGVASGVSIGLGPVLKFGQPWMQGELVESILLGRKIICLAITEPYAGSDVAGVTTTAIKSRDGSHYVVNGTKKWITNAVFADYFTTLCRLGGDKSKDLVMLLIPRTEGVTVRSIPTDYAITAGTGLISFENVVVPANHLIGKEGDGMKITMHNFNLERWGICSMVLARSRRIIEECFLWANQREVFGRKLIEQPVIRMHMGDIISDYSAAYTLYERITAQYITTSPHERNEKLGGPTALLKFRCTRMSTNVADKAVQIFGGRAVTKTGMGKNVSRFQKSYKLASVYGGSEEIMADLGMRQALKSFPRYAKL